MAERRVGTFDRTSPKPGDHGEFLTLVLGQIRTFGDYLGSDFDLRIKWPIRFWASSRIHAP